MMIGFLHFYRQNKRVLALVPSLLSKGELMLAETMRDLEELIPSPSDFVQKGEDGKTIIREDAALLIDAFGSRVFQSAKMSAIQGLGADAKLEKGLESAITQDIIEDKFPLIEMAGDFAGINVKKYLVKNPRAISQLLKLAGPYLPQLKALGQPQSQIKGNGVGGYG